MSVTNAVEQAREGVVDVAVACADAQYNPGVSPTAFLGTATLFGGVAAGAFRLADRVDGASTGQHLKKLSAAAVGAGAAALAGLDALTYAGHRIKGTAPSDRPTVIGRTFDTDFFQQAVLDSKRLPVRLAGASLVIVHAFAQGALEPKWGQSSE